MAITSRSAERAQATAAEIGAELGVAHDASDLDHVGDLVDQVESALGPIDILITNTGGPPGGPDPLSFTREQWEEAHRTLVLHPMALIERVLPGMRERGWGRIVNVSSTAALEPIPHLMLSNSHRSGTLAAFTTIARQVASQGVTLNTLLTGRIDTDRLVETGAATRSSSEKRPRARSPPDASAPWRRWPRSPPSCARMVRPT